MNKKIFRNFSSSCRINFEDRAGSFSVFDTETKTYSHEAEYKPFITTDLKIMWNYKFMEIYAEASNLFDTKYYDLGNIPLPGRWFLAGIKINLNL